MKGNTKRGRERGEKRDKSTTKLISIKNENPLKWYSHCSKDYRINRKFLKKEGKKETKKTIQLKRQQEECLKILALVGTRNFSKGSHTSHLRHFTQV